MSCCTGPLSIEVLIAPQTTTVKRALKNFLGAPVKYHHLIYAGHVLQGTGEWILQDDTFTFGDFAGTFKDPDVENALKQQEEAILNIHCFATGDWNNASLSRIGTKVLQMNLNPEDKLSNLSGVMQFNTYLCNYVKIRSLKEMLRSSDVVGNIRFSKPTLYVFPGCQGDSALFGISGFNLLVNGGYNKKACFWDFTRHLDRIDAMLLTHLGIDNIFGMNSVLQRKSIENVHPEIGHVYFNAYKGSRNSQDEVETEGKPNSLLVNLAAEGDKIVDNVRSLGQSPNPCYRSATATTIEPVNLYHKVGHGSLDMYILNPVQDSKELKEFYQQWSKQSIQHSNSPQFTLPNILSICTLLIWRPADQTENITRIFFPGNAPQHKIIEGLEKLKTLNVLKVPKCCDKELNAPKATLKKAVPSKTSATSRTTSKPTTAKNEPIKRESKVDLKSKAPAPKTNKVSKEDTNNKKASKTKEKGDKPKSAISSSPKTSPPTEVPPFSSQAPASAAVPEPTPVMKESPPDLVQKDNNLLVDFGSAPEQQLQQQQQPQQHTAPASDTLLDLIGHSSMKAESEQLLASDPACFMNNQSPDPLPDPSHVEHDTTRQPEDDQLSSGLNHKEMEDMGIYDDDMMVQRERSDDAAEADKLVSSSSDDKGFEEYDEEVQPESLPEPDLIMGSQPLQYDMPTHEFGGKLDSMGMPPTQDFSKEESFSREELLITERSDTVESMPDDSPSPDTFEHMNKEETYPSMGYGHERNEMPEDGFEQDMNRDFSPNADMTNSVYGNLMEQSVLSAEAFEQLQQECAEMENRMHESSSQEDLEGQQETKEFSPDSERSSDYQPEDVERESPEEEESPEPIEDDVPKNEEQECSSPEGFDEQYEKDFQPNEEQPEVVAAHEDENKENTGPDVDDAHDFDMHHSDSGTALDEQTEKESADDLMKNQNEDHGIYDEEDEDSEEVASQPEGDEPQMAWNEPEQQVNMQDGQEVQDDHEAQDGQEVQDDHEAQDSQEVQDDHEAQDCQEVQDDHEAQDCQEVQDDHEAQDCQEVQDDHEAQDSQEVQDDQEMQDNQEMPAKVNLSEDDMDSESQTVSSLPAAFEKDETPQPGDKSADEEERDDTDSIDGGTPEDEKDIDETFGSSTQQASDADKQFDSSTPHPAWSTTSNLSPLAPPFDPSGNQAFDPFGQQGANNFSGDDESHDAPGQSQEYESGFGEVHSGGAFDEKAFDPTEEWGKPMNLPSPPPLPPEVKKSNGVATKKPTSKTSSARTDRKLADTKKTETKKPTSTLGRSPKPALDRKAGLVKTEKPEKKLSNGDADVKSKPRSTILDKSKSSHSTTEKKPLTKTRPSSAASAKLETKTTNSALKTEAKSKLSSAKRPSTTTGSRASPASKAAPSLPPHTTFYVDLTYIPNHGDPTYSDIEFFKRIRARYYVLSALSPNPQILNALLEAKQTWEDKNLEVTVIPTYDNETLRHWMGLHRDELTDLKIDVAPSASRCTIQLQDHETSCSAYRLEF